MHELRTRSFGKRSYQNRWPEGDLERGSRMIIKVIPPSIIVILVCHPVSHIHTGHHVHLCES